MIELKRGADVENLKNMHYKKTRLEDTFGVNIFGGCEWQTDFKSETDHRTSRTFHFPGAMRKHTTLQKSGEE